MTFRTNISSAERDIHFATDGDDTLTGFSEENKVSSMTRALEIIGDFDTPPSVVSPASIITLESGTYSDGIVLPDFVSASCETASIVSPDPITITCGSSQINKFAAALNSAPSDGIAVLIDGQTRVRPELTTATCLGEDGIIFKVTGACDDIFPAWIQSEIRGERTCLVDHSATSTSPIKYSGQIAEFFDDDQTAIIHNPGAGSSEVIYDVGTIEPNTAAVALNASVATTSRVGHIQAGDAVVTGEIIQAETLFDVEDGARVILDADVITGKTILNGSGQAIYTGIAVGISDIELKDTSNFHADIHTFAGSLSVESGATAYYTGDAFAGSIDTIDGTLNVIIHDYLGVLPPDNGNINGVINGGRYGTWKLHPEILTDDNTGTVVVDGNTGNVVVMG